MSYFCNIKKYFLNYLNYYNDLKQCNEVIGRRKISKNEDNKDMNKTESMEI